MAVLVALMAVVVGLVLVLLAGLLRSHAEILRALHDRGVYLDGRVSTTTTTPAQIAGHAANIQRGPGGVTNGKMATDIVGSTPSGEAVAVAVSAANRLTLVAFLSSGCSTCAPFWESLGTATEERTFRTVIVTRGEEAESPAAVAQLAPRDLTTILSSAAWDAYHVPLAPYFVLVDGSTNEVVGAGAGSTWEQVLTLIGRAIGDRGQDVPPPFTRRDLLAGRQRIDRADRALRDVGIEPSDARLHPTHVDDLGAVRSDE